MPGLWSNAMQSWILDESPGAYRWGSIDLPELAADDVAIRVVASALNHMDLWVTRGLPKPPLPHVPGCDVAGIVSAIGADVTDVAVGDLGGKLGGANGLRPIMDFSYSSADLAKRLDDSVENSCFASAPRKAIACESNDTLSKLACLVIVTFRFVIECSRSLS